MTPSDSATEFRALLKKKDRSLKSLTVPEAAEFMFDFYAHQQVVGTSPRIGDGIGFTFDAVKRSRGSPYELSIIRLFTTNDERPSPNGSRLRLSLGYSFWTATTWFLKLDLKIAFGQSRFAWDISAASELYQELVKSHGYQVLKDYPPRSVELRYEPIWDLRG